MALVSSLDFIFLQRENHLQSNISTFCRATAEEYVIFWCNSMNRFLKGKDSIEKVQNKLSQQAIRQHRMKLQEEIKTNHVDYDNRSEC